MVNTSHLDSKEDQNKSDSPAPELLRSQVEGGGPTPEPVISSFKLKRDKFLRRGTYKPSHKATFIGLIVVIAILSINAGVITYLMRNQSGSATDANQSDVVISSDVLNSLGVNKTTIGSDGTELVVGPDASFNGSVTISDDVNIAGQLNLNNKITAASASLNTLSAGETSVTKLNINGDATASNLNLRENMIVVGSSQLQGPTTISGLLTINNGLNVTGNLSIGGTLSMGAFQTNSLVVGGQITTRGYAPSVSKGEALAATDTVSISGNDISGTVAVNVGTGTRSGILAYVSFYNNYSTTPHVVVTAIGPGVSDVYINRDASGFSIGASGIVSGGHAFDYVIMQ